VTKTALVTGATRGIGRATAVALARLGYDVAVTGRTRREGDAARLPEASALPEVANAPGSLESTVAAIEVEGQRAVPIVLDLLDRDRLVPAAEEAIAGLGHVDVVLNNAIYVGPAGNGRFLDTPADELEKRIFGNITAQLILLQPILRHMLERGAGTVAGMTSGAGYLPPPAPVGEGGWAVSYGVSKAGFHRIVEQLVVELGGSGLRFLNLQPGFVTTERVLAAGERLAFVAEHGAPVDLVGTAVARILDEAASFDDGANVQVQDVAKQWGIL
jgi:3-oxoacyl-[acyl-carrier protein] reductase